MHVALWKTAIHVIIFYKTFLRTHHLKNKAICIVLYYLDEEDSAGCFAFIVFRMSCYCNCSVALPHGVVGWSAVCDRGIS